MARPNQNETYLEVDDGGEKLKLAIAFVSRRKVGTKTDLLSRALGKNRNKKSLLVVDATAGLCRDSMHFLGLGCTVVALERNDQLYHAFSRLRPPPNFKLVHADAVEWLNGLRNTDQLAQRRPEIVYLDPMFPEKKKSAAVSKESRVLQLLESPPTPEDERALLEAALAAARDRVIVKRPKHAPWLAGEKPSHEYIGKAVRYDVYIVASV